MVPYQKGTVQVTSPYGRRILFGRTEMHRGIDLVGTDKTVCAIEDGVIGRSMRVTDPANRTSEWGEYVRLDLPDGRMVYYCHLAARKVRTGQLVRAGDAIGTEGATGKATGSHLHLEVRKNGIAMDPTELLGIENRIGEVRVRTLDACEDTGAYEKNGFAFYPAGTLSIAYHDAGKRDAAYARYANGGFFATYRSGGVLFTLPVANLCCDIRTIPAAAEKYLAPYVHNGKLRYGCDDNQSTQFHGKMPSTLVIPACGTPYVAELAAVPENARYAVSGVPTIRHGADVDYYRFVCTQGWDESCMGPAWRHWIGLRSGRVWHICGQTRTKNYIYGMEVWRKLQSEGFSDVLCLDGGGSYYHRWDTHSQTTSGNRQINSVLVFA